MVDLCLCHRVSRRHQRLTYFVVNRSDPDSRKRVWAARGVEPSPGAFETPNADGVPEPRTTARAGGADLPREAHLHRQRRHRRIRVLHRDPRRGDFD